MSAIEPREPGAAGGYENEHLDGYEAEHLDEYEDGNALAGPLAEIFTVDLTTAVGTCSGCRTAGPLAALRVYGHAPGLVARCPECGQVILRLVRGTGEAWLDLHGALSLRIPLGR